MIHNLRNKALNIVFKTFNPAVVLLQPVSVVENGVVINKSEFKPFDIAGSLVDFKSSDFSISSLESVGALSKLTTTFMSSMHNMNIADKFETLITEDNV